MINLADKRVCVTGGNGFLGSHIMDKLHERGCKHMFAPRSIDFDLRSKTAVQRMYDAFRPDIVIHAAAAVGGIEWNLNNPAKSMYDNLTMSLHLMQEGVERHLEKFVQIGSVCAYPATMSFPTKESSLWDGRPERSHNAYGVAKRALLTAGEAYRQQYGLNEVSLMPVNLYGPRDDFDLHTSHAVAALIHKIVEAEHMNAPEVLIWGTGDATREFLYVEDCAYAVILATERYNLSDPVNIGSGREIKVYDLARMIADYVGFKGHICLDQSKPDGPIRRLFDVTKAEDEFGFKASTSLKDGIKRTIDWYVGGL